MLYNLIYDNTAVRRGAGIFVHDCTPTISNNTIVGNYCTDSSSSGGGIYASAGGSYVGVNNILYFNQAANGPQWHGNANFNYSCSSQPLTGIGNIADNPQFVDTSQNNFHLTVNSPCIDAGDPSSPPDPDSTLADMGVYYYDQIVGINQEPPRIVPQAFSLTPPFPNPFNQTLRINFGLPANAEVNLTIHDLQGREMAVLVSGIQAAGFHHVTWQAEDIPSGIYLYRWQVENYCATGKVILLK